MEPSAPSGERTPTVGDVGALVESTRLGGQPVECLEEGSAATQPGSAEVTAYRVVQDPLIDVLKHAHGSRTVVRVRHGRAAVGLARRLHPDVVVMDVRMPVLDGIAATRQLAGPDVTDRVKVLVVTTFTLDEHVYEALRAGASGFLLKDAPGDQLLEGIRTVASGAALLAPAVTRHLAS